MNNDPLDDPTPETTAQTDEVDSSENTDDDEDAEAETAEGDPPQEDERRGVLSRRTVLAGFLGGVVAILAALALNPEAVREYFEPSHENVGEDAWLTRDSEEAETEESIVGTVRLESGQYTAQQLWAESSGAALSWSVNALDEGAVDVWVLPDDQIDSYQDRGDPRFNADLSESGISAETERTGEVTDGDWWIVLDNSSVYGADADGAVEFDVEMGIRVG